MDYSRCHSEDFDTDTDTFESDAGSSSTEGDRDAIPSPGSVSEEKEMAKRLSAGQQALQHLRCKLVAGVMVSVCILSVSEFLLAERQTTWWKNGLVCEFEDCVKGVLLDWVCAFIFNSRYLLVSLLPLADDVHVTRLTFVFDIAFVITDLYYREYAVDSYSVLVYANSFLFCGLLACAAFHHDPAPMQAMMWKALSLNVLIDGLVSAVFGISDCKTYGFLGFMVNASWVTSDFVLFIIIIRPSRRQWLQMRLSRFFYARSSTASAAGLAGLIGNCTVNEALAQAKPRFRCILVCEILRKDFCDSPTGDAPFENMLKRTRHCRLGDCDAFMSHSWHDPVDSKWRALQAWRSTFIQNHSREPQIWFDKACINQADIEADLRGLPISLAACSELLILWGPTYLSRLWCIVEIFVFIHMGGRIDQITISPVWETASEVMDQELMSRSIDDFDVADCQCYSSDDRDKMLRIIMVDFGDMERFNVAVRKLLHGVTVNPIVPIRNRVHPEIQQQRKMIDSGVGHDSPMKILR